MPGYPFTVVTDSSGFAIGAALCQNDGKKKLETNSIYVEKVTTAEMNYPTHQ